MKLIPVIIILASTVTFSVTAFSHETNGKRMARGLHPLPPIRRGATRALAAHHGPPSASPPSQNQCNTGEMHCCHTVGHAHDGGVIERLLTILGVVLQGNPVVGVSCTPITVIGVGSGANCAQQPVCCQDNEFNGLINVGCTPINIGL